MKKLILPVLLLCGVVSFAGNGEGTTLNSPLYSGSSGAWGEGKIAISIGYGFPNLGKTFFKIYENEANYKATGAGPIHFRGEYGLTDKIGFGLSVNYISYGAEWTGEDYDINNNLVTYKYDFSYSSISIMPRMNLHFGTSEKVDPYWGIAAGYNIKNYSFTSTDPDFIETNTPGLFPIGFETTIGLRYYFTPNIGAYAEFGLAKSIIQGGLAIAF